MKAIYFTIALLCGIVISPVLALANALFCFFSSLYLFWAGFFNTSVSEEEPNNEVEQELDIWERHIRRQKDTTKSSTQIGCEESSPD